MPCSMGYFKGQDTSLALGLVSHIAVLLAHAHHHALVPGSTYDGRKDCSGGVVSGKASFAHSRAIVNDKCGNVLVTHDAASVEMTKKQLLSEDTTLLIAKYTSLCSVGVSRLNSDPTFPQSLSLFNISIKTRKLNGRKYRMEIAWKTRCSGEIYLSYAYESVQVTVGWIYL